MSFVKFNKVVRSHEALILGLLVGVTCGVLLLIAITVMVKAPDLLAAIKLCEKKENVAAIRVSYAGKLKMVLCKDQRVFYNF